MIHKDLKHKGWKTVKSMIVLVVLGSSLWATVKLVGVNQDSRTRAMVIDELDCSSFSNMSSCNSKASCVWGYYGLSVASCKKVFFYSDKSINGCRAAVGMVGLKECSNKIDGECFYSMLECRVASK